jgi:lipopolysaccharide export system permease protein
MILFRYFCKEVFSSMTVITFVVLVIAVGSRFSGYLSDAASGRISREIVWLLLMYRLPGIIELILPISFFLAIMLAYGRLYADNEMIVLKSSGFGDQRILGYTLLQGLLVMFLTGLLSLWLKPLGEQGMDVLRTGQKTLTEFDMLSAGRFQMLNSGRRVTYVEDILDNQELSEIFISEMQRTESGNELKTVTMMAASGETSIDANGNRFLVLKDGRRYGFAFDSPEFQVIDYEEFGQLLEKEKALDRAVLPRSRPSQILLQSSWTDSVSRQESAELQWRIALIIMIPILVLIAVPLSRVDPREGRFARFVPGMVLCFLYLLSLSSSRSAISDGWLEPLPGLFMVHLLFLVIALTLFFWQEILLFVEQSLLGRGRP